MARVRARAVTRVRARQWLGLGPGSRVRPRTLAKVRSEARVRVRAEARVRARADARVRTRAVARVAKALERAMHSNITMLIRHHKIR